MNNLELIESHIVSGKPLEFIRNCISCAEVIFKEVCSEGYTELCKFMIEAGADVHSGADYVLRWASKNGHLEVVKLLEDWIKSHG